MMSRELPILFNTDMVKAVLDGRKSATRRAVKQKSKEACGFYVVFRESDNAFMGVYDYDENERQFDNAQTPPCQPGDILYVRETWTHVHCIECNMGQSFYIRCKEDPTCYDNGNSIEEGCFIYRADYPDPQRICWRPSIHMPKEAARIWLKVTDVKVERLQDMTLDDFLAEGVVIRPEAFNYPENDYQQARSEFKDIWDSKVKKTDQDIYGWDASVGMGH